MAVPAERGDAAARRRSRSALHDEGSGLAEDPSDREEMLFIREQMAELAPAVEAWVVRGEVFSLPAPSRARGHE